MPVFTEQHPGAVADNAVEFVKRPEQGKMKNVAFFKDPDGYWIEIVPPDLLAHLGR